MKTIALLGYYGVGNLGDEAVVATLIRNIHLRLPDARIVGISLNPADTRARHGIDALPIRRMYVPPTPAFSHAAVSALAALLSGLFLKVPAEVWHIFSSWRALLHIDAVVVPGSGGVYDWWHGAWTHPFTHFRWAMLCRLSRTRLVYMSVGAGPFKTRLGRWFFRYALSSASYRSVRDDASRQWMNEIGVDKSVTVYPDMAFDLTCAPEAGEQPLCDMHTQMRVGINALPYYHDDWSALMNRGGIGYNAYIGVIAEFVDWLIGRGCQPVFFHSQIGDGFLDRDIAEAVDRRRQDRSWRALARFPEISTQDELLKELSGLDFVMASRFHAVLFSYLLRKPVLGISYHHKVEDLMRRLDQSAYVLDIQTLSFDCLAAAFTALEHEVATGRWSLQDGIFAEYRTSLGVQFDEVFLHHATEFI